MISKGKAHLTATAARVASLVPDLRLREALERSFSRAAASVQKVEQCFELLPAKRWSEDVLSTFLHSWKATHLKMLGIYGLSCRIQRLALNNDGEAREQLWMAAARNAETSYEDLGLDYGGVTHAALYDDMARSFVPSGAWIMEENGLPAALEFKRWVYEKMIVDDIPTGLLTNMFSRSTTTPNTRWPSSPSPNSSIRTMTSPRRRRSAPSATSARTSATRRR